MIRLFLDQALPLRAEGSPRQLGFDVIHATSAGMSRTSDDAILEWCDARGYVLVTHDHGFHQRIVLAEAAGPSVIRIRLQGLDYKEIADLIDRVVRAHEKEIASGALVSVSGRRVKVRSLPFRAPG